MKNFFDTIMLPPRPEKPRQLGMTMVLDKNMGLLGLADLMETAAPYIDIMKFAWGTSRVIKQDVLVRKIEMLKANRILCCPGGTLMEIAFVQNRMDEFLPQAAAHGFDCLEVSDGTVQISSEQKISLIKKCRDAGFRVISEVGKKNVVEDRKITLEERLEAAHRELEAGAFKIIFESRETGSFGIFNDQGEIIPHLVEQLVSDIGLERIIFEAPHHAQQLWLINNLGNQVNLGNVSPPDCINLETLRLGLRSGTLRKYHLEEISVCIENGVSGALEASTRDDVVVVVDAIRASTTIITALVSGMRSVKPVSSAEECVGEITAGERGGKKIAGLMYDNSPIQFSRPEFKGKNLVLTTSNGTECIRAGSRGKTPLLIGGMVNARAAARRAMAIAREEKKNISVVMAGRNNQLAVEDLLAASEIVSNLRDCTLKGYIQPVYSENNERDFLQSDSGKNLLGLGRREDIVHCARKDIYDAVPRLNDEGYLVLE